MINKEPLVSIIIPVHNAGKYITQCLQSVLSQSWKHLEIIIVNDGSTDNSEDIIKSFRDDRIQYYCIPNQGQCKASNYGLAQAKGDYIKFLDADDLMNETHIESLLTTLDGSQTAIAFCAWARFYNDNLSSAQFIKELNWQNAKPLDWIKTTMSSLYDMMPGWLWLIPKKLIDRVGGWNDQLSLNNDFEFSIRLVLHSSSVLFSPESKIYYRSGNASTLSSISSEHTYQAAILSAKLGCANLLSKDNSPSMRLLCANKYSYWLYRVYPYYPALVKELEHEIKLLGGANRKIDESPLMRQLQNILGWKAAKRIKMAMYNLGYERHLLAIKKRIFPPSISTH